MDFWDVICVAGIRARTALYYFINLTIAVVSDQMDDRSKR